jgi:glycosyltransferase involved in cell wall biosynthesis
MSVYNGERYLALAIDSILAQTFTDFEFLILNDGSKDSSAAIIDAYAAKDKRIRATHRENKGLVASLNELIEQARAPLIARMDCDDIAMPERFAKQVSFLDAHQEYGVVGTWIDDIDANGAVAEYDGDDHPTDHASFLDRIGKGTIICHSSVMMRRDLVKAAGCYHGAFRHCEDFDLWLRLASITKLCSLPERLMQYRHWEAQVSNVHALEQLWGSGISMAAYKIRINGGVDPTEKLEQLPAIGHYDDLDILFAKPEIGKEIEQHIIPALLYSETSLKTGGFDMVLKFIRRGGNAPGLWRTTLRLLRIGAPLRAAKLALALTLRPKNTGAA